MRRRTFIQLALATAVSPQLLRTELEPVSVLRRMGYRVEPYAMPQDEFDRAYRPPVGISGFRCPRGHQRAFAGVPGERKLRCVGNWTWPEGMGLYWPESGRGSADGFVRVSSWVGNPGDPRDLGVVHSYVYRRSCSGVCTVLVAAIRLAENQASVERACGRSHHAADRDAQHRTRRVVRKGQVLGAPRRHLFRTASQRAGGHPAIER